MSQQENPPEIPSDGGPPPSRKRKSRWGDPAPAASTVQGETVKRKSRWGPSEPEPGGKPNPLASLAKTNPSLAAALGLQQTGGGTPNRINDIWQWLQSPKLPDEELNRSPSPEPIYDKFGKRTNTRDMRVRERLIKERYELIEAEIKSNPSYRPPPDFKPGGLKKIKRVSHAIFASHARHDVTLSLTSCCFWLELDRFPFHLLSC